MSTLDMYKTLALIATTAALNKTSVNPARRELSNDEANNLTNLLFTLYYISENLGDLINANALFKNNDKQYAKRAIEFFNSKVNEVFAAFRSNDNKNNEIKYSMEQQVAQVFKVIDKLFKLDGLRLGLINHTIDEINKYENDSVPSSVDFDKVIHDIQRPYYINAIISKLMLNKALQYSKLYEEATILYMIGIQVLEEGQTETYLYDDNGVLHSTILLESLPSWELFDIINKNNNVTD